MPWTPPGPTSPPPYQGQYKATAPEGYTFWAEQVVRTDRTHGRDHLGRLLWEWDVTVYYAKVDDPAAPLRPLHSRIWTVLDLRAQRIHQCEYWKKTEHRSGRTTWSRVVESRIEPVPAEHRSRAEGIDDEQRLRAIMRRRRAEEEAAARRAAEEIRRAEEAHRALITEHRRRYRVARQQEAEEIDRAEEAHRALIEEHRRQYREEKQTEAEQERAEHLAAEAAARAEATERAAAARSRLDEQMEDATSFDEEMTAAFAAAQTENARALVEHATEPAHVADALSVLEQVQSVSSESGQQVLDVAVAKQGAFVEEQIDLTLRRPDDASAATLRTDAKDLGGRLVDYQALGGDDELIVERALTRMRRIEALARERDAVEQQQVLEGRSQISDPQRGLGAGCRSTDTQASP